MKTIVIRCVACQLLLGSCLALGQVWVTGPNRPVAGPAQMQAAAIPAATVQEATVKPRGVAEVTYANGLLKVAADNSSLNEILRSIAHETGMKITGGVRDESVFGTYGPSAPGRVLASLLDGTSSNMMLRESDSYAPAELILTPRLGSPTPPEAPRSVPAPAAVAPAPTPPAPPMWVPPPPGNVRANTPLPAIDPNLTPEQQNLQLMQQELQQQLQRQPQHGVPH